VVVRPKRAARPCRREVRVLVTRRQRCIRLLTYALGRARLRAC
jgi:hypothetical protein